MTITRPLLTSTLMRLWVFSLCPKRGTRSHKTTSSTRRSIPTPASAERPVIFLQTSMRLKRSLKAAAMLWYTAEKEITKTTRTVPEILFRWVKWFANTLAAASDYSVKLFCNSGYIYILSLWAHFAVIGLLMYSLGLKVWNRRQSCGSVQGHVQSSPSSPSATDVQHASSAPRWSTRSAPKRIFGFEAAWVERFWFRWLKVQKYSYGNTGWIIPNVEEYNEKNGERKKVLKMLMCGV